MNKRIIYAGKCIVNSFPSPVKSIFEKIYKEYNWRSALYKRSAIEYLQRFKTWENDKNRVKPYVIYMTGMPRTGSSFMKNYLADYAGLKIMPFEPKGFHKTWKKSLEDNGPIYVDKSTHYIRHLKKIIKTCGSNIAICCIVRDPRDQLTSLFEFDRHPELERTKRFWDKWFLQYNNYLTIAKKHPNISFFLIRYEDLARSPEQAKACFLAWLGMPANENDLKNSYSIAHANDIQDDKVKNRNRSSTSSIGRFTKVTDPDRAAVLNVYQNSTVVSSLMKKFGYLPTLSDSLNVDFENVTVFRRK